MKRFKKLIPSKLRLPYVDTIRRSLSGWDMSEQKRSHQAVFEKCRRNKTFRKGTIGGLTVVAIDGVEVFESIHKYCNECLTRVIDGVTHYFHHFADIVVADALYMNKPWIETVLSCGMDAVIRVKEERLTIVQDALGLFSKRNADASWEIEKTQCKVKRSKNKDKKITVSVWDEEKFEWNGLSLRFLRFIEEVEETIYVGGNGKRRVVTHEMWIASTVGKHVTPQVIWEI